MMEIMVVSNVVLWIAVIGLGVLSLALARQIGLLHERSAPLHGDGPWYGSRR